MNWLLFVIVIIVFDAVRSKHFYGGTISWIPLNNNDTTLPIEILITQTYMYKIGELSADGTPRTCTMGSLLPYPSLQLKCTGNCASSGGYQSLPISTFVTGSSPTLDICYSQRTDLVNLTNINAYFTVTYGTDPNSAYTYRSLSTTLTSTTTTANWNLSTVIDIRRRSDGLINTPPVANLMSPYGIPYNKRISIPIPTSDIDGDDVRCRWSSGSLECGEVCFPSTIPSTTTLSSDCVLNITGLSYSVWYCAAIQVEDFENKISNTPLSSVPLQILIYVYNTTNCLTPELSSPYDCLSVLVNTVYTTTIYAHNYCGSSVSIADINVQAIPGVTTSGLTLLEATNKSLYSRTITYKPNSNQVGVQLLCSTAINSQNIPSAQYCITFIVRSTGTTNGSSCSESEVTTEQTTIVTSESIYTDTTTTVLITSDEVETSSALTDHISSSTTTTTTKETKSKPEIDWRLIVGISLGFAGFLALLACCCCCCYWFLILGGRRRRRKRDKSDEKCREKPSLPTKKLVPIDESWKSYINYRYYADAEAEFNNIRVSKTDRLSEINSNICITPSRISLISSPLKNTPSNHIHVCNRHENKLQRSSMPHVSVTRLSTNIQPTKDNYHLMKKHSLNI